jgi:phospholipid/cholesterol/gamma-HCH transport system substrate-binding protein
MAKRVVNNVKLGTFVLGGLLFLVLLLYMIGKDKSLFGSTYVLKARFENTQGLVTGNNVRFSGIQSGTVKKVEILNDTVIEVTMVINTSMLRIIRKNAIASIGTDGLVGNKVVNIVPARIPASLAIDGDILVGKKAVNTEDMLQTLQSTTLDVADIAENLKTTIQNINNSNSLWALLNDQTIPKDLKIAVANIRMATVRAGDMIDNLNGVLLDVKNGRGSVGALLKDSSFAINLKDAVMKIAAVAAETDSVAAEIDNFVGEIREDVNSGKGPANAILKDSMMMVKINESLVNIQKGTEAFNENMEALKHNYFFRRYYKNRNKQKEKEIKQQAKTMDTVAVHQ